MLTLMLFIPLWRVSDVSLLSLLVLLRMLILGPSSSERCRRVRKWRTNMVKIFKHRYVTTGIGKGDTSLTGVNKSDYVTTATPVSTLSVFKKILGQLLGIENHLRRNLQKQVTSKRNSLSLSLLLRTPTKSQTFWVEYSSSLTQLPSPRQREGCPLED